MNLPPKHSVVTLCTHIYDFASFCGKLLLKQFVAKKMFTQRISNNTIASDCKTDFTVLSAGIQ